MKKFIENNLKLIIGLIIGAILAGGIVYAATSAREVTYTTAKNGSIKNVEEALNDLYSKSNGLKDIISIPVNYAEDTFEYNCGFKPSFIYMNWSNNWCWMSQDNKQYVYYLVNGSGYNSLDNGLLITNTGFSLNTKDYSDLAGLSATIYIVK